MEKVLRLLIYLLSFMVVFTACSGGGSKTNTTNNSGTGGGNTQINNTQQGAQTSITTRNIANEVIGSFGLTNLVGTGNVKESLKHAYDLRKYIIKIRPMFNRAQLFSAAETSPCDNQEGTSIYDDLGDNNDMTGKITFQNCRLTIDIDEDGIDDYLEFNGAVETTCSDDNCDSITVTFGENGQQYIETVYADSSYSNTEKLGEFKALCELSHITDYGIAYTETIRGDGFFENKNWAGTSLTDEQITMDDFLYIYTESYEEILPNETFNINNSSIQESTYENNSFMNSKKTTFKNFHLLNRLDDSSGYNYVTIDGIYTVELTPQDSACFVGTFSIDTIEELTNNLLLEQIIDGKLKINENTTVIYDLDIDDNLTISVTVNGQTSPFSEAEIAYFEASCPQLISISAK